MLGRSRNSQARLLLTEAGLLAAAALLYAFGLDRLAIGAIVLAMGLENAVFQIEGGGGLGLTYVTGALVKVGELLAEFQWLTPEEAANIMADSQAARQVRAEIGDVFIYLTRLADVLGVDLLSAAADKLVEGERRYDVATYRGSRRKAPAEPTINSLPER